MRTIATLAVLAVALAGPTWSKNTVFNLYKDVTKHQGVTVCDYRKDPEHPTCERVRVPAKTIDRLPGASADCATTGDKDGPKGCTVLQKDADW